MIVCNIVMMFLSGQPFSIIECCTFQCNCIGCIFKPKMKLVFTTFVTLALGVSYNVEECYYVTVSS